MQFQNRRKNRHYKTNTENEKIEIGQHKQNTNTHPNSAQHMYLRGGEVVVGEQRIYRDDDLGDDGARGGVGGERRQGLVVVVALHGARDHGRTLHEPHVSLRLARLYVAAAGVPVRFIRHGSIADLPVRKMHDQRLLDVTMDNIVFDNFGKILKLRTLCKSIAYLSFTFGDYIVILLVSSIRSIHLDCATVLLLTNLSIYVELDLFGIGLEVGVILSYNIECLAKLALNRGKYDKRHNLYSINVIKLKTD
ncbi:lipid-transfer protein [Striga asiatica]|uniref:Lipid-transfer protein n=1 Tax=Striga asiatica TaxID=4170 RepID=A0A5A7QD98_STRAF|nr:lipid-transfer protein [Striga asiatica]